MHMKVQWTCMRDLKSGLVLSIGDPKAVHIPALTTSSGRYIPDGLVKSTCSTHATLVSGQAL